MRDVLVTMLLLGPVPFVVFGRPNVGVVLWLLISYMNPHHLTWGFAYDFPFAMIVWIATVAGWLLSREPKSLPWTSTTALLVALMAWITVTTWCAVAPDLAFAKWDRTIKILLGALLTLAIMRGRARIEALAWVTAGSLAFYGVKGGLFAIATGGNYRVTGAPDTFIGDNNQAAVAMLMVIPLLRYLQMNAKRRWLRTGLLAAIGLTLLAILATYSRGAIVGLGAGAVFLWLKSRRKLAVGAIMSVAIIAAVSVMPGQWVDRINSTANYQDDSSTLGRFDAWHHAVTVAVERPLTGGGFGTFSPVVFARYSPDVHWRAAHSIYFEVLGEQGFVGLILSLVIGLVAFLNGTWVVRKAAGRADLTWAADMARMLQVSLVGYAVGGAFLSLGYFDLYYGLVVMMVLTRLEVARALAEPEPVGGVLVSPPGEMGLSAARPSIRRY